MEFYNKNVQTWKNLSWDKSLKIVLLLQKHLFRSVYVKDFKSSLNLQKVIFNSSSSRLVAIRYVTQICPFRKISGVDSKVVLSFLERFELNEFLKNHFYDWFPQSLKFVSVSKIGGDIFNLQISTVSDRAWQYLLLLGIEPTHQALFHPRQIFSNTLEFAHISQRLVRMNIDRSSYGFQKRVLKVEVSKALTIYSKNYLLQKIFTLRSVKLSISRLLNKGFQLNYFDFKFYLSSWLFSIVLMDVSFFGRCLNLGYLILYFLKPLDNELVLITQLKKFFDSIFINNCRMYCFYKHFFVFL